MKKFLLLICLLGLIFTIPGLGLAEQEHVSGDESSSSTVLESIIVSASRKDTTILNTPTAITIITAEDIRNSGQNSIARIIANVPGVVDDSAGNLTYFSVRGTRSTLSCGPVIYIDGRPLNFGGNNYSKIDSIPVDLVERIEIIKAPPASIYGADASRGVINIITKTGKIAVKPFSVHASGEYGSWDSHKELASVTGKGGLFDYSLSALNQESSGYRYVDTELKTLDGQIGYAFEGGRIDAFAGYNDYFRQYTRGLNLWQFNADRRKTEHNSKEDGAGYVYKPSELDQELASGGLSFKYDRYDWLLNASVTLSQFDETYDDLDDYNDPTKRKGLYKDDRNSDRFESKISGGRTFFSNDNMLTDTIVIGYDYSLNEFENRRTYPWDTYANKETAIKKANVDYERDLHGIFANNDLKYGKIGLLAGLRYDMVKYKVETQTPKSVGKDFDELGWDFAPSYSFTPNSNLFFSMGKSYWYPVAAYYTYAFDYGGNENKPEDLRPEEYMNYEIGFKHRMARYLNYSIIYYYTKIDDKFITVRDATGSFKGYANAGTSIHQGVELEADGRPCDLLGYRLGFTTIDAEWDNASAKVYRNPDDALSQVTDISGKKLPQVPTYEYTAGLDFYLIQGSRYGECIFSVDVHGFGKKYIDYNNNFRYGAVDLVDCKLSHTYKNFEAYLLCSNLFDKEYEKIGNSDGRAFHRMTGGTNGYFTQDGRYIAVGASIKF